VTGNARLAEQIKRDYREAPLDARTRALLDFAVQVTREVQTVTPATVDSLRRAGWSDAQIHDAVQVIALFNYYTRLADALGVDPEDFMGRPAPSDARRP
jgi:uncharacterized peroxidase-related enzyme